jgi:hypothetical protein
VVDAQAVLRYAHLLADLARKRQVGEKLAATLIQLEFHGREISGERALLGRLGDLLARADEAIKKLAETESTPDPSPTVEEQLAMLDDVVQDVDWDLASEDLETAEADLKTRDEAIGEARSYAERLEKLFAEVYGLLEDANRQDVRLASEVRYTKGTLDQLARLKQALTSRVYVDVPKLQTAAREAVARAHNTFGAPLDGQEHLQPVLEEIRERIKRVRPFSAQAELLLLRSDEQLTAGQQRVKYTVLLRTPSRPGMHGVNIQGASTLNLADRIELSEFVARFAPGVSGAQARGVSTHPTDDESAKEDESEIDRIMQRFGARAFSLILPEDIQRYLCDNPSAVTVTTNDLDLPWELIRIGERVLCLEQPMARMPMGHAVPRRAEHGRSARDQKRFLLVWSDPYDDLPWARQEIESIAKALRAEPGTEVIVEPAVTNKMLNDRLEGGEDYDVIHYAGHAHFHPTNSDESALLVHPRKLAGGDGQKLQPDHFYAEKIRRILHGQPLVFLNACETAQTRSEQRDETGRAAPPGGLASAFVYGGAKACVGSLWPVRDDHAAHFAVEFYKKLLEGETIGEAMRLARKTSLKAHDRFRTWSTFVLYGNPMFRL